MANRILTELPKRKDGKVNWGATVGMQVECLYEDAKYIVSILDYDIKNRLLTIKHGGKEHQLKSCQFSRGGIGNVLDKYVSDYRYNIGDIITVNGRDLKILDRFRQGRKYYTYECLNCSNKDDISETSLTTNSGCNVCCSSPSKILKGYNDLATTNPAILKYLVDKNDAYKYSSGSGKKVLCSCPLCGIEKPMVVHKLCTKGFSCNGCSDGVSYPNKFMFHMFSQLGVKFEAEKTFSWSEGKRYDFYLPNHNILVEAHGMQHYQECGYSGRTLEDEQENDRIKVTLARTNGIERYIVLDCRESVAKFLINSVESSELNELFNLSNVDWKTCDEYAIRDLSLAAIEMWNQGIKVMEISKRLGVTKNTVIKYLKNGSYSGRCDYDPRHEMIKSNTRHRVEVFCKTDGKKFNSITDCAKYYGTTRTTIRRNSKGEYIFSCGEGGQ